MTGYALNAAIGLQVLLGSLTTGLSAVATSGKSVRFHVRNDDHSTCLTLIRFRPQCKRPYWVRAAIFAMKISFLTVNLFRWSFDNRGVVFS